MRSSLQSIREQWAAHSGMSAMDPEPGFWSLSKSITSTSEKSDCHYDGNLSRSPWGCSLSIVLFITTSSLVYYSILIDVQNENTHVMEVQCAVVSGNRLYVLNMSSSTVTCLPSIPLGIADLLEITNKCLVPVQPLCRQCRVRWKLEGFAGYSGCSKSQEK